MESIAQTIVEGVDQVNTRNMLFSDVNLHVTRVVEVTTCHAVWRSGTVLVESIPPGGQDMDVTLDAVAAAAGVSKSTASRALSGSPRIRPETKAAVQAAAARLGYRPNRIARGLRTQRSGLVGLVVTNLVNASFHTITEVIQRRLDDLGYQVLLCVTEGEAAREKRYLEALLDHRVDGLIIVGTGANGALLGRLWQAGTPIVNLLRAHSDSPGDTVTAADRAGALLACRHLLALGHRRIGYVGGPSTVHSGRERFAGYAEALAGAGVPVADELVERGPYEVAFGAEAVGRLLTVEAAPTAIYLANHEAAFGALPSLAQRGMHIPDAVSVICHEDVPWFPYWHPPVSIVDNGARDLGELAVDQLLRCIERDRPGEASPDGGRQLEVGARLVVRGSTAAPRN